MRKTKINLLQTKENYQKAESFFFWVRIFGLILSFIFFIIFIFFFLIIFSQNKKIDQQFEQKKILLESLQAVADSEAQLIYLQKKYQFLQEFLKDDARFLPYYNLLNSALLTASPPANLISFKINKNREVDFTVSFLNLDQLLNFFKFVESENFLNQFEKISLKGFDANFDRSNQQEKFELSFTGKFIPIKNENF